MVSNSRGKIGAVGLKEKSLPIVHEASGRSCVDGPVEQGVLVWTAIGNCSLPIGNDGCIKWHSITYARHPGPLALV